MKAKFTQFDAVVNILFNLSHIQISVLWHMLTNSEECIESFLCIQLYFTLSFLKSDLNGKNNFVLWKF